jgi:hypothetical protein
MAALKLRGSQHPVVELSQRNRFLILGVFSLHFDRISERFSK